MVDMLNDALASISMYLSFILTTACIIGFFALAIFKNTDVTATIPMILGIYITNRTAVKFSAHRAAMLDPAVNTTQVITSIDDK
jgi:uncharacterized membrane protein (DUF485 family)